MSRAFRQALENHQEPKRPGKITFTNELGNKIELAVYSLPTDGIEGVMIFLRGPTSDTENHITKMEAEKMYEQLGHLLGHH